MPRRTQREGVVQIPQPRVGQGRHPDREAQEDIDEKEQWSGEVVGLNEPGARPRGIGQSGMNPSDSR